MASSNNGAGGAQSPAPEVVEVIRKSSLAALVLTVPEEVIVAASPAAVELLGSDGDGVEGRSFEEFTADEPSGALDLILAGRLQDTKRPANYVEMSNTPSRDGFGPEPSTMTSRPATSWPSSQRMPTRRRPNCRLSRERSCRLLSGRQT